MYKLFATANQNNTINQMKTIELESIVQIFNAETAMAYAQIINIVTSCQTQEGLSDTMAMLPQITTAHLHFGWGFGASHFWLKQRKERNSPELFNDRVLIVKFNN